MLCIIIFEQAKMISKRIILCVACLIFCYALFVSCGNSQCDTSSVALPISEFVYPKDLLGCMGIKSDKFVSDYSVLGSDYFTDIYVSGSDAVIVTTDGQRDNLIKLNNDREAEVIKKFLHENADYHYEKSEDNNSITFYFDEKLSNEIFARLFYNVICGNQMNHVLNNDSSYSIYVKFVNCHTQKVVAEGYMPGDKIQINKESWAKSYE